MDDGAAVAHQLADLMVEFGLESASIECDGVEVAYSRHAATPGTLGARATEAEAPVAAVQSAASTTASGATVNSPAGGIFYSRPSPGATPFVEVGGDVQAGDVIGIIEAMKVFNEITSTMSGTVAEIVAKDGQLVNPGDPLIRIS